jgi:hypothetical protein
MSPVEILLLVDRYRRELVRKQQASLIEFAVVSVAVIAVAGAASSYLETGSPRRWSADYA